MGVLPEFFREPDAAIKRATYGSRAIGCRPLLQGVPYVVNKKVNWQCKTANCNENPLDGYYDVTPRVYDVIFKHLVDVLDNFDPVWSSQKGRNDKDNYIKKSSTILK